MHKLTFNFEFSMYADNVEEGRSVFQIITGKAIGKRPLGWPRQRGEQYYNES